MGQLPPKERVGKRIKSLRQLSDAAVTKKSVVCRLDFCHGGKPTPAAWALHWPGAVLLQAIDAGVYIYKKPQPRKVKQ